MSAIARAPKHGRVIVALCFLVAWCPRALALDPSQDISQYAHTAWTSRQGFFNGTIYAIAQTPDGYLWLGTSSGLLRFDGDRSLSWQPPTGENLPSSDIRSLVAARDGTLWIGTFRGLASWKDGSLIHYHELDGQSIFALLEDREGTLWAGTWATPAGRLCEIHSSKVSCHGEDGSFDLGVLALFEDSSGNLWAGAASGLWRWKPGMPKLFPMPEGRRDIRSLMESDKGAILVSVPTGIRQFLDGKVEPYAPSASWPQFKPESLLRDRDGGLWIGTQDRGLLHVHQGRLDVFAQTDGLSGDRISRNLFEDREGVIWVPTANGLDRFRTFAAATISVKQGLSVTTVSSVLSAKDGSVWLGTSSGLNRWKNGQISIYRKHPDLLTRAAEGSAVHEVIDAGMPDDVGSLFQDDQGRIWVFSQSGVAYFGSDRFTPVSSVPGGFVHSVAGDKEGNLWISYQDQGLYHLLGGKLVERIPWAKLGKADFAYALSTDPARGGVWLGFYQGGLVYLKDGQIRASYQVSDGLGKGTVNNIRLDPDGALWAATEGGLSRVQNGRVATLTSLNGLPCDAVNWVIEDDSHSIWLYMPCGMVRIDQSELQAWGNDRTRRVWTAVFGSSDGVSSLPHRAGFSPQVAKSADGKLWFLPGDGDGVSVFDPRQLQINKLPPPVHVEHITANRKTYDASSSVRLPPLIGDVEIDYTALSLVAPEKNQFRYKLEAHDREWQSVGNRRQAFYNDLAPGNYRFRVIASNNSGVWNEQGASLDFSIAPAYWQTTWFRAACVVACVALLWTLYRLRLRQIRQAFNARMEERVGERTRLARDLHDTLLQSFQGLLLRFQTAYELYQTRPAEGKKVLESAIDQTAQAITEGRNAVQGLRASTVERNDLAKAITTLGKEIAAVASGRAGVELRVEVEGTPRTLHPIVRDEIYRIASEALRNAFRHSEAKEIEVELRYDERQLRLRIRDDGRGIDPTFLGAEGREGHFGLHGMHERAKLMGGELTVWTAPDSGTEIELSVPAVHAYATSSAPWRSWFTEKFSGRKQRSGNEQPAQSDADSVD
jgi:signal transduction histidine kinase/ligand-binding sensor domain-containing protein